MKVTSSVGNMARSPWPHSWLWMLLAVLSLLSLCSSRSKFPDESFNLSCIDGQCNNCSVGHSPWPNPASWNYSSLLANDGCLPFYDSTFDGADTKTGGGYDVWWNLPQPAPGCQIMIARPTENGDLVAPMCGNIILIGRQAGCYYTHINGEFAISTCCDTSAVNCSMIDDSLHPKSVNVPNDPCTVLQPEMETRSTFSGTSLVARAAESVELGLDRRHHHPNKRCDEWKEYHCGKATPVGAPYNTIGGQVSLTADLSNDSQLPGTLAFQYAYAIGSTLTATNTTTVTKENGGGFKISLGFDLTEALKGGIEGGPSWSTSHALAIATGFSNATTITWSATTSISLPPGVRGALWLQPEFTCQRFDIICNGAQVQVVKCDPIELVGGGVRGEIGLMVE